MASIICPYCGAKIADIIEENCKIQGSCRCPKCNGEFGFERIHTDKVVYHH